MKSKKYRKQKTNYQKKYIELLKRYTKLKQQNDLKSLKEIDIPVLYTDGGYNNNKKVGSWAFGDGEKVIDSSIITNLDGTWNIQSETTACIKAIEYAESKEYKEVLIVHDLKGLDKWFFGYWKATKPCTIALKELKNKVKVKVSFRLVKGHSGCKGNEIVDSRCEEIIKNYEDLTK